jgi:hypothetical protein
MGIVGEGSAGHQLANDVSVDRFIGVHGPRTQLRHAKQQPKKCDK